MDFFNIFISLSALKSFEFFAAEPSKKFTKGNISNVYMRQMSKP